MVGGESKALPRIEDSRAACCAIECGKSMWLNPGQQSSLLNVFSSPRDKIRIFTLLQLRYIILIHIFFIHTNICCSSAHQRESCSPLLPAHCYCRAICGTPPFMERDPPRDDPLRTASMASRAETSPSPESSELSSNFSEPSDPPESSSVTSCSPLYVATFATMS